MNSPDTRWHSTLRSIGVLLAILSGLALRLWFVRHANAVAGDSLVYGEIATNWLQHNVFGFSRTVHGVLVAPRPTLIRLPGYPLFLLLCFRLFGVANYGAVVLVQVFVDLAAWTCLADLARRLFGTRAGLAALWLGMLCPFTAGYVATPLTETLTLACIVLAFYALERWRNAGRGSNAWLLLLALALAYALLLRPEQGLLAASVVPAMLWMSWTGSRQLLAAIRPALIVSVLTLLPLVPWTIRNERTFHVFQPLAPKSATDPGDAIPNGFYRWYRTWGLDFASTQEAYWNYDGAPIEIDDLPSRAFDSPAQYAETESLLDDYNEKSNATPAFDARFNAIAVQRIQANPLRYYLELPVARLFNMILRPRTELFNTPLRWWRFDEDPAESAFAFAYAGLNLGFLALGVAGFLKWRRAGLGVHTALAWSMAATILLRCLLLLTLDNSEPRYTLEFFPVLILFAAALWLPQSSANLPTDLSS